MGALDVFLFVARAAVSVLNLFVLIGYAKAAVRTSNRIAVLMLLLTGNAFGE
jgi:hypothetical protein